MRKELCVAVATFAFTTGGCEAFQEPKANEVSANAYKVENRVINDIENGQAVEIVPGAVVVNPEVNLRQAPAPINYNTRAFIDGVSSVNGNFVLTRPVVVKNDKQLDGDPDYWLMGKSSNDSPTEPQQNEILFVGLSKDTLDRMRYYVKKGQEPASICPDSVDNTYKTPVKITLSGEYVIRPDDYDKSVAKIQDLSDDETVSIINDEDYVEAPICR